jgi:hypothetical protein
MNEIIIKKRSVTKFIIVLLIQNLSLLFLCKHGNLLHYVILFY